MKKLLTTSLLAATATFIFSGCGIKIAHYSEHGYQLPGEEFTKNTKLYVDVIKTQETKDSARNIAHFLNNAVLIPDTWVEVTSKGLEEYDSGSFRRWRNICAVDFGFRGNYENEEFFADYEDYLSREPNEVLRDIRLTFEASKEYDGLIKTTKVYDTELDMFLDAARITTFLREQIVKNPILKDKWDTDGFFHVDYGISKQTMQLHFSTMKIKQHGIYDHTYDKLFFPKEGYIRAKSKEDADVIVKIDYTRSFRYGDFKDGKVNAPFYTSYNTGSVAFASQSLMSTASGLGASSSASVGAGLAAGALLTVLGNTREPIPRAAKGRMHRIFFTPVTIVDQRTSMTKKVVPPPYDAHGYNSPSPQFDAIINCISMNKCSK